MLLSRVGGRVVSLVNRRCLACAQQGQGALAAARRLHTSSVPRIALSPLVRAADASSSSAQQQQQQQPQESFKDKLIRGLGFLGGFYTKKHVLGRLHQEGKDGKQMYKALVELFWKDVEFRMRNMGVDDSQVIQESTRELFSMFYGLLFAYDEGICGDDVLLAEAVWRNLFHSARDDFEMQNVALMVRYIRREMQRLDDTNSLVLLEQGSFKFGALPLRTKQ